LTDIDVFVAGIETASIRSFIQFIDVHVIRVLETK